MKSDTMKKACLLTLLALLLALSACNEMLIEREQPEAAKSGIVKPEDALVGTWVLVPSLENLGLGDAELAEMGLSREEAEALLKDAPDEATLVLSEDRSAVLDMYGEIMEGSWKTADGSAVTLTLLGADLDAVVQDGELVIKSYNRKLTFLKREVPPGDFPAPAKNKSK